MVGNGLSSSPSNTPPPHDKAKFPNVTFYDLSTLRPIQDRLVDGAAIQRLSSPSRCRSRCRPFPCTQLSRARSTTAAPPRPDAHSGRHACPPPRRIRGGEGGTGPLPTFTDVRCDGVGAQLYRGGIATSRTSQSWPGPPAAQITQTTRAGRSKATTCPAPQSDPSTRFSRSRTTHGASATGSVSLRLSVLAGGHEPSGSSDTSLRCRGCSRPHP
jgi:hypothetical protein